MSRANLLPFTTLALIVSVPLTWLACGGGSKPAESPSSDTTSSSSAEPSASDTAAAGSASASASAAATAETPAPASTPEPAEKSSPPPPAFSSTDCGKCVDKTCAKQAAACGKDNDCQSTLDTIHNCTSGAGCVDSATAPSAAKPKKLAAAFEACGKKATGKGGACAKKCQ
jgi:hypothetical protein